MTHPANRLFAVVNGAAGGQTAGVSLVSTRDGLLCGARLGPPLGKRPIRFTVGEPGRRSTVWRVWAPPGKDDVYIASRQSVGIFKISLHESGDWRCQWVKHDHEDVTYHVFRKGADPDGRIIAQWQRPPPIAAGWTEALSIWVPGDDILAVPGDGELPDELQWITAPDSGEAAEFRFWFVQPRKGSFDLTAVFRKEKNSPSVVNGFRLASGEVLLVLAAVCQLDDQRLRTLTKVRRLARACIEPSFDMSPATGPRTAVLETEEDGHANVWDLSLLK